MLGRDVSEFTNGFLKMNRFLLVVPPTGRWSELATVEVPWDYAEVHATS